MEQSALHSSKQLSPRVRSALEEVLGRTLREDEAISVRAYEPQETASAEQEYAQNNELRRYFAALDERTKDIPDCEQAEIIEEAIRSVRPGYQPIR